MTSWHFNFNLTFSHLTISEGQRNCMITRMEGDATHAASSEQHPNFSHNFPHGQTQRRESASKVEDSDHYSPLPTSPFVTSEKEPFFLQSNDQAGIPRIPDFERTGLNVYSGTDTLMYKLMLHCLDNTCIC